jgi:hypothetical protein
MKPTIFAALLLGCAPHLPRGTVPITSDVDAVLRVVEDEWSRAGLPPCPSARRGLTIALVDDATMRAYSAGYSCAAGSAGFEGERPVCAQTCARCSGSIAVVIDGPTLLTPDRYGLLVSEYMPRERQLDGVRHEYVHALAHCTSASWDHGHARAELWGPSGVLERARVR